MLTGVENKIWSWSFPIWSSPAGITCLSLSDHVLSREEEAIQTPWKTRWSVGESEDSNGFVPKC